MDKQTEQAISELRHEIGLLKSKVAQLEGELQNRIKKDEVIHQINISQETFRINADKIEINSNTISNAHIKDMKTPLRI